MESDVQEEIRQQIHPWRQFFSLRELAAQMDVPTAVLQKFLAGRSVYPSTLRKMLDWLAVQDTGREGELIPVMDRLLKQALGDLADDAEEFATLRRKVWRDVGQSYRHKKRPVPAWMARIAQKPQEGDDDPNYRF